jgi:hypothetical protein
VFSEKQNVRIMLAGSGEEEVELGENLSDYL